MVHFVTLVRAKHDALVGELRDANAAFERFVPTPLVRFLGKRGSEIRLGDHRSTVMTVLFCDMRDFTSLAETMLPEQTFRFLNSYFSRLSPVVRRHGGFIAKYVGDGFMALFPHRPDDAVNAAIELQRTIGTYNSHRARSGYRAIDIGIGIHTGLVTVGIVGEHERIESTAISDAVNVASRLEGLTKDFGVRIIASRSTIDTLHGPTPLLRPLGDAAVKGRQLAIPIVEVVASEAE